MSVTPTAAGDTISNLNHVANGAPKSAIATTNHTSLAYSLTYNGTAMPPIVAESYAVLTTITDTDYTGSASGMLAFANAMATVQSPSGSLSSWDHSFYWTGVSGATENLLEVYNTASNTQVLYKWYKAAQVGCASGSACAVSPSELSSLPNSSYKWLLLDYGPYGYWTPFTNFVIQ